VPSNWALPKLKTDFLLNRSKNTTEYGNPSGKKADNVRLKHMETIAG
jgi:hypothetical protein